MVNRRPDPSPRITRPCADRTPPPRRPAAGGFSLVEMVICLAVVTVLTVGMASSLVLATRALPHHQHPAGATIQTAEALQQLRDDLRTAVELTVSQAHRVTLTLPDRDGDGRPEVITYAWSATPGDPLTRTANDQTPVTLLESAADFTLAYTTQSRSQSYPGPALVSSEQLLGSFVTNDTSNTYDHKLNDKEWIGTLLQPSLPAEADSWTVTRAMFYGNKSGGSGSTVTFELRESSSGLPNSDPLASTTRLEATMNGWNWYDATFNAPDFAPGQQIAVVLANYGGGDAGVWSYYATDLPPSQMFRGDGANGWTTGSSTEELQHYIYGTYQSLGQDWTHTRHHVTAVDLRLVHGQTDAPTQRLRLPLPNAPHAVQRLFEADFAADPTALDLDADGQNDWSFASGPIPDDRLVDGGWLLDNGLELALQNKDFNQPATVTFWIQDTTNDASQGGLELRLERSQGDGGVLQAIVGLTGITQTLEIAGVNASGTFQTWCEHEFPAGQAIAVALIIDPDRNTVAVVLDGTTVGAWSYATVPVYNVSALASVATSSQSGVRVDHLRVSLDGDVELIP